MEPDLEEVLRGLAKAAEFAKMYRFEMTDDYRAMLARIEAMPENQSGADKSHVWPAQRSYIDTFKHVRRLPRHP